MVFWNLQDIEHTVLGTASFFFFKSADPQVRNRISNCLIRNRKSAIACF